MNIVLNISVDESAIESAIESMVEETIGTLQSVGPEAESDYECVAVTVEPDPDKPLHYRVVAEMSRLTGEEAGEEELVHAALYEVASADGIRVEVDTEVGWEVDIEAG